MRKNSAKGFTLIEILLVMLMTAMILLMVSQLTSQTFGTLRFLQQKSQTLQSASLGLDRLSSELREAVEVTQVGGTLIFDKVNFAAPECVNNALSDPPTAWVRSYADINQIGTVTYTVTNGVLNRTASFGGTQTTAVATRVDDFNVERSPTLSGRATRNNVFLVTLAINEDRRIATFEAVITVPGEDA